MEFGLTTQQRMLRKSVRDFVRKEVAPTVLQREQIQDPNERFPWDILEKGSAIGLRTMTLEKEYGGAGLRDPISLAIVGEELAYGDVGIMSVFDQANRVCHMFDDATDEQKKRFLIPFRDDPRYVFAIAAVEPDFGSDSFLPYAPEDPRVGMSTTATRDGEYVVIKGTKEYPTLGEQAKLVFVFARTDTTRPQSEGTSIFMVPQGTPGMSVGHRHERMGMRLAPNCELMFHNCRVPMANLLGQWNRAVDVQRKLFRGGVALAAAAPLGIARAALDKTITFAKNRVQGGKPIIQHPNIAAKVGRCWAQIQAARLIMYHAAWSAWTSQDTSPALFRIPKAFASEVTMQVTLAGLEIHAGAGDEAGMSKLVRDATVWLHCGGANDTLFIGAGNDLAQWVEDRDAVPLL